MQIACVFWGMKLFTCFCLSAIYAASSLWADDALEANKTVAKRVFEDIFNQGQFDVANEIYSPSFVNHAHHHRDIGLKRDQDAARGWKSAFPDLKMTVNLAVAEGDLVALLWTGTGTNTGEGNGIPATGQKGELRGITIWRIQNGRITEEWSEFDQADILKQLRLTGSPK